MSYKRFLVVADNHGSLGCPVALKKLLDFKKTWKPHYTAHLGDLWDFQSLRKGASQEERAEGVSEDYRMGLEFLDAVKPDYLTLGNHDDRIWLTSTSCNEGILRERCLELAQQSEREFAKREIEWVPYHVNRFLQMPEGGPKFIHGFYANQTPAKSHHSVWGACMHGHVHRPDVYTARHIDGDMSMSLGCMADINRMSYADRSPAKLQWRQGWAYGLIHEKTGKWSAWQVVNENGVWLSPMGVL